jgi:hypothetical protein
MRLNFSSQPEERISAAMQTLGETIAAFSTSCHSER